MKKVALSMTLAFVFIMVIGLIFVNPILAKIEPKSNIGLWLFDDGTGKVAKDSSGNGNDGTLQGDPKWVDGKFGKALSFNGTTDYVGCGNKAVLGVTKEVTVQLWFKTGKAMPAFGDRQVVVGKHYLEYEVGIYPAGAVHTYTSDGTAAGYDEGINVAIAGKLPDGDADWVLNKWYHLAWTLKDALETVYVNGIKIGEFTKPHAGTQVGTHNVEIGRRTEGSLPFTGTIDEVAIFNVALAQA
ncbi:MAG: LamG domain-containing protein, partial [Candidatus Poribacteria bacterium]